jgi:hypothetical protein
MFKTIYFLVHSIAMLPLNGCKDDSPVDSEGEVGELEAGVNVVPEVRLLHHNARVSLLLKMHTALHQQIEHKQILKRDFLFFSYNIQHCFICRS